MKISVEKFEIEIDPKWVESLSTFLLSLNNQNIQADAEAERAQNAPLDQMFSILVAVLPQLVERWLNPPEIPFPGFKRAPHLRPVDFEHSGRVPTPTDIQDWIKKRQEAGPHTIDSSGSPRSVILGLCEQCNILGPREMKIDHKAVRCMWCAEGIEPAARPAPNSLEYMDGPKVRHFDPFDPAS